MWLSHHGDYKSFYIGAKFPEADFAEFQRTYSKQRKNLIAEQNNETLSPELIFTEADELKLQLYRQVAHEIKLKYWACRAVDNVPEKLWYWSDDLPTKEDIIIRITEGYILIHESCLAVLQQFNLGHNRFTQVPIYEFGSDKLINNEWYFFEVCDWRSYFIPELSDEQCKPKPKLIYDKGGYLSHKFFSIVWGLSGTYAMSKDCLTCDLDLWHDPRLDQSICISDRLKDALVKSDMADKWFFQACKIIG